MESNATRQAVDEEKQLCDGHRSASETDSFSSPTSPQETAPSPQQVPSKPDGGRAWLQVVSGFMLYFNSWGMVTAFGVFQEYYKSHFIPDTSNSAISWIGTLQGFLLALASIFAGPILDRGHVRFLVLGGTFFVVFGLMMTSLCHTYWQLILAQGICIGIGAGQMFIVATAVLPGWFSNKLALATGLSATGSSLGAVIYPIVFHRLEPQIGFGWTVRVMGFIALGACLVSLPIARMRSLPPPRPKIIDFTGFKEHLFALFALVSFLGGMGLYIPFFYATEYALEENINARLAFYMLPILGAGSIVGRTLPAFLADRWGMLRVLTTTTTIASILAFCWIAIGGSAAGFIVWALLYGAFSGAFVSLQTSTVASITPDLRMVGGRIGTNNLCIALGVLIGNPVAGVLHGNGSKWLALQCFCGASLLASSMFSAITLILKLRANARAVDEKT